MTLSDLMNELYAVAVREAMMDLILGRSDNAVKVGDVVEMLLSISFESRIPCSTGNGWALTQRNGHPND